MPSRAPQCPANRRRLQGPSWPSWALVSASPRWQRVALVGALGAALAGCCAFSTSPYRGRPSPHYHHGAFHNEAPALHGSFWGLLRWQLTRKRGPWREWVEAKPGPKPPRRVAGSKLRVTFINHATTLVQLAGLNILTDPIYSKRASPLSWIGPARHRPPGIRFADLPPIDIVVISHNHYDHMDLPTLKRLARAFRPRFFVGLGNAPTLRKAGISRVTELDWWQSVVVRKGVRLHAVPAQHFSQRGLCDGNQTQWAGFVVESKRAGNVYFAGDTGFGPHFRRLGKRFAPLRLALLPIGAYRPRWFMKGVHLDPREAVRAHMFLGARHSVAIHFGTFALADDGELEPVITLKRELARQQPRAPFRVLGFGEGWDVP
jgi:L-ascorbate metabolism protein UlaG (beta-lactamase superfamily)